MNFSSTLLRALVAAALAVLLAACGGQSQVAFNPGRILVFGDQASVITDTGRKYTVNALAADGTIDCVANPIWVQVFASSYGMVFPQCVGTATTTTPASRILAQPGALANGTSDSDLVGQITLQLELPVSDGGGISSSDLVTVYIGTNDVVAAYAASLAGAGLADVQAQVDAAGITIANQLARIASAGGKVMFVTVPDVGLTPFGRAQDLAGTALLTALTLRLNNTLLLQLNNSGNNNGREIGLIEINPILVNVMANPAAYSYVDVLDAACVPTDPLLCTTDTLTTNPDGSAAGSFTWLWASDLQFSPGGHLQLGNLAASRAHSQPF